MTTTEIPNEAPGAMPVAVAAPDLFGGSLFGDELIDMYNSDAVVGAAGEIPSLLPPHPADETNAQPGDHTKITHSSTSDLPVDGLGAFLPSTSFNDLTTLLPPPPPETALPSHPPNMVSSSDISPAAIDPSIPPVSVPPPPPVPIAAAAAVATAASQKRTASAAGIGAKKSSVSNKRIQPNNRAAVSVNKKTAAVPGQTAANQRKKGQGATAQGKTNTPNPLTQGGKAPVNKAAHPQPVARVSVTSSIPARSRSVIKADSITSEAAAATAAAVAAATAAPASGAMTTEADFKSVAQAAVANLILNAGTGKDGAGITNAAKDAKGAGAAGGPNKADTSTAHIRALTGNNWVAACSGSSATTASAAPAANGAASSNAAAMDSKVNRNRRQNLTPDERARQNRDRNREHARNTRLRKKAYVEELKRTLTEMVSQRDAAEVEKRHTAQRELEQREVRFRVMEEFLKLRGRNELNAARWVAILEDNFSLTLPVTDYRKMVDTQSGENLEQVLRGASEAMADAGHLCSFLQTLGHGNETSAAKSHVSIQYQCDRKTFFMDGCTALLAWRASSAGAVNQGAPMEMTLRGNMTAKFSPASNKLISAEIMFDTGTVATQLQHFDAPKCEEEEEEDDDDHCDAVAAAAASKADAILDSLQMPQLGSAVPVAITVVPAADGTTSAAISITSTEKEEPSDETIENPGKEVVKMEHPSIDHAIVTRSSRRKD